MLLELLRYRLSLAVAGGHGRDAQVGARDHTTIGTMLLDHIVA
jgi:hypothetical protein